MNENKKNSGDNMFLLTRQQFSALQDIYTGGSPTRFAEMYDQIYAWVQTPDARGNVAEGNTIAWFGAAAQTNRGKVAHRISSAAIRRPS
jgi:hypothetical protein